MEFPATCLAGVSSGGSCELGARVGLPSWAEYPHHSAANYQQQSNKLRGAHDAAKHRSAIGIGTEKLQKVPGDAIEKQIRGRNLSFEAAVPKDPKQKKKNHELSQEFINLSGMEAYAERRSRPTRQRISEGHSPRQSRGLAIAASRGKAPKAANRMTDGDARSK